MRSLALLRSFIIGRFSGVMGRRRVDAGNGSVLKRSAEGHSRSSIGVDPEVKDVRPRVMAYHVEVELATFAVLWIDVGNEESFGIAERACKDVAKRRHNDAASLNEHGFWGVALDACILIGGIGASCVLARTQYKATPLVSDVAHGGFHVIWPFFGGV